MRIFVAVLTLACSSVVAEAKTYGNARFGYFVEVPDSMAPSEIDSENGDGASFQSPDKTAQLLVYGGWLSDESFGQNFKTRLSSERERGWGISYQKQGGAAFGAYSGRRLGRIVYGRVVPSCNGKATANFRLEYPAADKAKYDGLLKTLNTSLHSGKGNCN